MPLMSAARMAGLVLEHSDDASGSTQDTAVDADQTPADITVTITAPSPTLPNASHRHTARSHTLRTAYDARRHDALTDRCLTSMLAHEDKLRAPEHKPPSRFEQLLASTVLPEYGPAHFAARRALWCRPMSFPPASTQQNPRLLELLEQGIPLESDEAWNKGMNKVWEGVTGGVRLKRRLPMKHLVRVA